MIINTGATPIMPDILGMADNPIVHTSTSIQHVDPLPPQLIIVGVGPIALEFAGMFARFGSRVTVLDRRPGILPEEDDDVAEAVRDSLTEVGVEFLHDAELSSVDGTTLTVTQAGAERTLTADALLIAIGRRPATDGLGLEAAGIDTDDKGAVAVDDQLRSISQSHVFAVGDLNGGPQFTYISYDDHRIVLDQLTGQGRRTTADRVAIPYTTFLTPPLGRVGLNEKQAGSTPIKVAAKKIAEIAAMPRPKIVGETHGMIKFVVDAESDKILGATLFCIDAQELVNLVALAIRQGATAADLRDGIWTHPSSTEAFNEVLAGLH